MLAVQNAKTKALVHSIVAILKKLGQRGFAMHEELCEYSADPVDTDSDPGADGNGAQRNCFHGMETTLG